MKKHPHVYALFLFFLTSCGDSDNDPIMTEEATEERTQAGEPQKVGKPAKGKKASLRKGKDYRQGMAGHGVRKTPRSVRSCEWSRQMQWALTELWVF